MKVLIDENRKYHNYKEGHVPFAADWGDDLYCWDEATGEIWIYFPDDDDPIPVANSMDAFLSSIVYQEEGKKVMDQKYLPLGSIVILEGGIQKMLIISRALNVNNGGKQYYFDYGAVPYPEGLVSDQMAYFNADAISRVVFEGYHDVDDEAMMDNIRRYIEANPDRLRGDPKNWQV